MSKEFDDIRIKVRKQGDVRGSTAAFLKEVAAKFRENADNPQMVRELADELDSNGERIVDDINSDGSGKSTAESGVDVSDAERAMQGPTTPKNAASKAAKNQHTA